jgi:hypothetical protein
MDHTRRAPLRFGLWYDFRNPPADISRLTLLYQPFILPRIFQSGHKQS